MSLITLIDRDTQILNSTTGLDEPWSTGDTMPLEYSYCQYAITTRQPLLIEDTTTHPLSKAAPRSPTWTLSRMPASPSSPTTGTPSAHSAPSITNPAWTDKDVIVLSALADILTTQLTTAAAGRHARVAAS